MGDENNLTFNPQKYQVLLSTRKYKYTLPDKLSIKGTPIEFSTSMKYLGLLIEKSLSWHSHLKKQCTAAKNLLMMAKAAIGAEWGLTPERIKWIHSQIVRPKVAYGASVWAFRLTQADKDLLNSVQRLSLLNMTSCMRSTPTAGLEAALGIPLLSLYFQRQALNAVP